MAQVVEVRGKKTFVCDYTGAQITHRFFVPTGKNLKGKQGCFCTLPVLLRAYAGIKEDEFVALKDKLCKFYDQEDIPIAPALPCEQVPLFESAYEEYLRQIPLGLSWLLVKGAQSVGDYDIPIRKLPRRAPPAAPGSVVKPQSVGKGKDRKSVFRLKKGVYIVKKNTVTQVADVAKIANIVAAMTKDRAASTEFATIAGLSFVYSTDDSDNKEIARSDIANAWIPQVAPYVVSPFLFFCPKQTSLPAPNIPRKSRKRVVEEAHSEVFEEPANENPFGPKSPSEEGSDK